jgi:tetratricopeptide (TPR) repeat protein
VNTTTAKRLSSEHRTIQTGRFRWLLALVFACAVCFGTVWLISWYQQDRPLHEIESALRDKNPQQALKLVNRFLRDNPESTQAQVLKARVLVEVGRLPDALRLFHRIGASEVADLHAWAKAHLLREEWSDALPVLERLLQIKPDDPDALHEITACQAFLGKYREALASGHRLTLQPGHEARAWLQLGTLQKNQGNDRSAIESWNRVLEYDPQAEHLQIPAADFFSEYGRILLKDGKPDLALTSLQHSLEIKESAGVLASLGQAQQNLGRQDGALISWKRAVELDSNQQLARESLAQAALRAGQADEAQKWLEPIVNSGRLGSSVSYLMQRICQSHDDREGALRWQERTELLRKKEKLLVTVNHVLIESPESYWARAIRAYRFAESGNWSEAEAIARSLLAEPINEPFVTDLVTCIRTRGTLPSLELLPVHKF